MLTPDDKFNFVAISGYLLREPSASSLLRRLLCCILGTSFLVIRGDESIYRRWSFISQGDAAFASLPTRCPMPTLMLLVEPRADDSRPLWRLDEVRGDQSGRVHRHTSLVVASDLRGTFTVTAAYEQAVAIQSPVWGANVYSKPSTQMVRIMGLLCPLVLSDQN